MAKGAKTGGRRKGTQNKMTVELKDAILKAATGAGGAQKLVGYLQRMANQEPQSFLPLLGKLLPKDVNLNADVETLVRVIDHTGAGPVIQDREA